MTTSVTILFVVGSVSLFLAALGGGLLWGMKRQGFFVPGDFVEPRAALSFDLGDWRGCPRTEEDIDQLSGMPLTGSFRARMVKLSCDEGPVAIVAIHWSTPEQALSFWKRYKRSVKYTGIGLIAFHNSLVKPYFFVGKLGAKPQFDLSAWYDDKWYFLIAVSTLIPEHHEKKLEIKNRMLKHFRQFGNAYRRG